MSRPNSGNTRGREAPSYKALSRLRPKIGVSRTGLLQIGLILLLTVAIIYRDPTRREQQALGDPLLSYTVEPVALKLTVHVAGSDAQQRRFDPSRLKLHIGEHVWGAKSAAPTSSPRLQPERTSHESRHPFEFDDLSERDAERFRRREFELRYDDVPVEQHRVHTYAEPVILKQAHGRSGNNQFLGISALAKLYPHDPEERLVFAPIDAWKSLEIGWSHDHVASNKLLALAWHNAIGRRGDLPVRIRRLGDGSLHRWTVDLSPALWHEALAVSNVECAYHLRAENTTICRIEPVFRPLGSLSKNRIPLRHGVREAALWTYDQKAGTLKSTPRAEFTRGFNVLEFSDYSTSIESGVWLSSMDVRGLHRGRIAIFASEHLRFVIASNRPGQLSLDVMKSDEDLEQDSLPTLYDRDRNKLEHETIDAPPRVGVKVSNMPHELTRAENAETWFRVALALRVQPRSDEKAVNVRGTLRLSRPDGTADADSALATWHLSWNVNVEQLRLTPRIDNFKNPSLAIRNWNVAHIDF